MNEAIHKKTAEDPTVNIDGAEVVQIVESIQEAQNLDATRVEEFEENYREAQYFDASSMAALTPTSLVSGTLEARVIVSSDK